MRNNTPVTLTNTTISAPMMTENIIALSSLRLQAKVCLEKRKPMLLPCDSELYPSVKIECFRDLNEYQAGDTLEVEVIEMQSSNGQSYFYSF